MNKEQLKVMIWTSGWQDVLYYQLSSGKFFVGLSATAPREKSVEISGERARDWAESRQYNFDARLGLMSRDVAETGPEWSAVVKGEEQARFLARQKFRPTDDDGFLRRRGRWNRGQAVINYSLGLTPNVEYTPH